MPSNHLILCRPLLLLPSIFPSIRVSSSESALRIRWPKYWSFSFSISPSNDYSGLISFRMDWFDLHAVQGSLKSLLQYHSAKALILRCSAFFMVRLSHPYTTAGKTAALTRRTFVSTCVCAYVYFSKINSMHACLCTCIYIHRHRYLLSVHVYNMYVPEKKICKCSNTMEKGAAILSSILAWKISRTEKPGGLWSMGLQRVGQD